MSYSLNKFLLVLGTIAVYSLFFPILLEQFDQGIAAVIFIVPTLIGIHLLGKWQGVFLAGVLLPLNTVLVFFSQGDWRGYYFIKDEGGWSGGIALMVLAFLLGRQKEISEAFKQEIIERQKSQTALIESEERFRILVQHSSEAICIIDQDKIIDANQTAINLLGPKEHILNSKFSIFIQKSDQEAFALLLAKANGMHTEMNASGHVNHFPVELYCTSIPYQNRIAKLISFKERPYLQKMERAQPRNANTDSSTIDKNRMVLDIHSIINSMKDLSGTVSHDLNNFLMGLYGNFELIQNTPLDRHPVYIERIELLLNSLQDFSSSMSKYASKTPTPHLLDLSVTEITEDIISQNPEFKGIQIEKQAECIFKGNPSHITEALTTVLYRFALNDSTIQFATVLPNNIEWILKTTEYSFALCIPIDQQSKQTIESLLIYSVPRLQHQKGLTPLQLIHTFSIIASFNGGIGFSNKYLYLSFPSQVEQSPTKHSKSIID